MILASIDHLLLLGQVDVPTKDRRALNLMEHGAFDNALRLWRRVYWAVLQYTSEGEFRLQANPVPRH